MKTPSQAGKGQGLIFGHPKGLYLVSVTELWERFSYYGMLGLLVLYLTDMAGSHGLAWPKDDALKLYGIYTGLVFAVPAVGGWISSRFLGERRSILWGGLIVTAGHLLLGGPAYFPLLAESLSGLPLSSLLTQNGMTFDHLFSAGNYINSLGHSGNGLLWMTLAYYLKVWSFLVGLLLIVIGTGLIKPSVSSIINCLYERDDPKRNDAFGIFMVCIYLGSFSANFVAGTLGEKLGWHYGFSAAAIGMLSGVLLYIWKQNTYLGDAGREPAFKDATLSRETLKPEEKSRIALLLLMAAFTIIYAVAFYQKGGLLNLYAREYIDRHIAGFEIPITWLLTISTGIFIILTPVFSVFWRYLGHRGIIVTSVHKLSFGLLLISLGYLLLILGDISRDSITGQTSVLWIIFTYVCFGLGDVMIWPPQIAAAASLSPPRYTSFTIGAWYLTIGIGTWITGYIGALSYQYSPLAVFVGIGGTCLVSAALVFLARLRLMRLAHGAPL